MHSRLLPTSVSRSAGTVSHEQDYLSTPLTTIRILLVKCYSAPHVRV